MAHLNGDMRVMVVAMRAVMAHWDVGGTVGLSELPIFLLRGVQDYQRRLYSGYVL